MTASESELLARLGREDWVLVADIDAAAGEGLIGLGLAMVESGLRPGQQDNRLVITDAGRQELENPS